MKNLKEKLMERMCYWAENVGTRIDALDISYPNLKQRVPKSVTPGVFEKAKFSKIIDRNLNKIEENDSTRASVDWIAIKLMYHFYWHEYGEFYSPSESQALYQRSMKVA